MEKEKSNLLKREILFDRPSDVDEFSGGGHYRTAKSLANTIRRFDNQDHSIGLEGSWGSGKSTIVNLATSELESKSVDVNNNVKHLVFTFDLWANQTTHFRRAFLESFLKWGLEKFPNQKSFIKEKQKQVGDRTKIIETDHTREFSLFGIIAICFLFMIPAIYTWFSPFAFNGHHHHDGLPIGTSISIALIVLMIILTFVKAAISRPKNSKFFNGWKKGFSQTVSIFSKESDKTTITQNIRDEDPTQYEFHNIFREIVKKFQEQSIRLVIVFDNIDRLPSDRISDTWSEVRSVFLSDEFNVNSDNSITGIVPYDRTVAMNAMKRSQDDDMNDFIVEDVFRKSFDAILHVSPPVISDAAAFFIQQFNKATNDNIDIDVAKRLYKIFDLHVEASNKPITPRQVISYINSVMSWWELRDGDIPLESIAVFVAHQSKLEKKPSILNTGTEIEVRMRRHANQPNLNRDLAALMYNVEPELALQVSLQTPIRNALIATDFSKLNNLAKSSPTNGFDQILPRVIDENCAEWSQSSPEDYAQVITNLSLLEESADLDFSKRALVEQAGLLKISTFEQIDELNGVFKLINFTTKEQLSSLFSALVKWINQALPKSEEQTMDHGQKWIAAIGLLCDEVEKAYDKNTVYKLKKNVTLPRGVKAIIGVAYDCDQTSCHITYFSKIYTKSTILTQIKQEVISEADTFVYAWQELKLIFDEKECLLVLQTIIDHLQTTYRDSNAQSLKALFKNLKAAYNSSEKSKADKVMKDFIQSGGLSYHTYQLHADTSEDAQTVVSIGLWLTMTVMGIEGSQIVSPQATPSFGNMQAQNNWFTSKYDEEAPDDSITTSIAKYSIEALQIGPILSSATKEDSSKNLFKNTVRSIFSTQDTHAPNANVTVLNYDSIKNILGDKVENLLFVIGQRGNEEYWSNVKFDQVSTSLVSDVASREEEGWEHFNAKLDTWLKSLNNTDWSEILEGHLAAIKLLSKRAENTKIQIPSANLTEPLITYILSLLNGTNSTSFDYSSIVDCLPTATKKKLSKDVFDRHNTHTDSIGTALFAFSSVMENLPFSSDFDRTVERYIFPLIKDGSKDAIEFMRRHQSVFRKAMKEAKKLQTEPVIEYLEGIDLSDTENENINSINDILKIKIPERVDDEKQNEPKE